MLTGMVMWPGNGPTDASDGTPLNDPAKFKLADLGTDATWGFSNHASSWRKEVWEGFPFDEKLMACEDKEWMWRVLSAGFSLYADPRLVVASSHGREAGLRPLCTTRKQSNIWSLRGCLVTRGRLFPVWCRSGGPSSQTEAPAQTGTSASALASSSSSSSRTMTISRAAEGGKSRGHRQQGEGAGHPTPTSPGAGAPTCP